MSGDLLPNVDASAQVFRDARHLLWPWSEVFPDVATALLQEYKRFGPKQHLLVYEFDEAIQLVHFFGIDLSFVAKCDKFSQTRIL